MNLKIILMSFCITFINKNSIISAMSLQIEEFQGKFCDYYSADYDLEECGKLTSQNQCKTLEGTPCVFPFMFRGLEVTECISGSPRTLPWCATQINSYGEIVGSQWRNCDKQSCPTDIIRSPFDSQMDCPKPDWIGDGTCDKANPKFNMDTCQFDRGDCCEEMLIGNGVCEEENNFASCGNFDGGDCQDTTTTISPPGLPTCLIDWAEKHAKAYEDSGLDDSIGISVNDYSRSKFANNNPNIFGRYIANVKSLNDTALINGDLVFHNHVTNYCMWKQDTEIIWWIGKCENVGENFGIAYMDDCDCPYDSSCTWKNYLNYEVLNIEVIYEDYNLRISNGIAHAAGAGPGTQHLSSAAKIGMLKMRGKFRKRCKWSYSNQLRRFVCDSIPVVPPRVKSPPTPKIEIPGCFQNGKDYAGSDIFSSSFWTSNAERCQKLCQNNDDCQYWTWILPNENDGSDGSCYLKSSKGRITDEINATSGPKHCSSTTPATTNFVKIKLPIRTDNAQDICTNVPKVTKTILDCRLLANQETFPYSLEKMKNCLQEQFLLHVANKGSTSGTLCVEAVNVINRIQNCKTSSSSTDEFKDCLFKRILELISTTDTTTTTTISPPVGCHTIAGPNPDKPCIFPFYWNGVTYNGCPIDPADKTKHWCSTKVDSSGNHVVNKDEWGHCSKNCQIVNSLGELINSTTSKPCTDPRGCANPTKTTRPPCTDIRGCS